MKIVANEIFGVFSKYNKGECTYDRALEEASIIINKYADKRPIVGYVQSDAVEKILHEILSTKKVEEDKSYIFDCKIHKNEIQLAERIYKSIT